MAAKHQSRELARLIQPLHEIDMPRTTLAPVPAATANQCALEIPRERLKAKEATKLEPACHMLNKFATD